MADCRRPAQEKDGDLNMSIQLLIQHRPTVWRQYVMLAVLLLALIIDGLDLQLLSLVSPLLISEWGVSKAALGPAMSAAVFGMSVGAFFGGWLGDRLGRRRVLMAAMLLFGVATAVASHSPDLTTLTILRVVGGLGFGAAAPNAVTLVSEWLGGALRLRAIGWMSVGTPLGGLTGALILIGYLSELGWRGSFLLCGLLTLGVIALVAIAVPESPGSLVRQGRDAKLAAILERWFGVEPENIAVEASRAEARAASPAPVEPPPATLRFVLGTGLGFFCTSFLAYGCGAWLPVMVTMNGLPVNLGLQAAVSFNLCAVAVAFLSGLLAPRWGTRSMMGVATVVTAAAITLLLVTVGPLRVEGWLASSLPLLLAAGMAGGGTGTVLACLYMVLTTGHPSANRSGGVGLGMMVGRGGGIASTFSGGYLLGSTPAASWPFFAASAIGVVGAALALVMIDRHVAGPRR
jgi:MFS transporter, AAHS family, 4-hydroxybenzoate transporter